ncbi:MAG: oligopeptidase A, partial [Pseudomonadales bacterium]|nr:oligopeptidase A [Pseudomonadales bacterium]
MPNTQLNLPQFSHIAIDAINPQLDDLLSKAREQLQQLKAIDNPTWQNFAEPVQHIDSQLEDFFSPVSHLNGVQNSDALREQYQQAIAKLTAWGSEIGQDAALFAQYKKLAQSAEFANFDAAQQAWVEHAIRSFKLAGVDLEASKQQRFQAIKERLAELSQSFSNHVLDATDSFEHLLPNAQALAGVPDSMLAMFKAKAEAKDLEGYLLGLDFPSYHAIISYADNASLRKKMYMAFQTKASDQAAYAHDEACQYDNSAVMVETLKLKQEMAALLDFSHYAERSLFTKMAESVDEVVNFLLDLSAKAKPYAEQELAELANFAKQELAIHQLQPWDISYVSEKYRVAKFNLDNEKLREYFPVDTVL